MSLPEEQAVSVDARGAWAAEFLDNGGTWREARSQLGLSRSELVELVARERARRMQEGIDRRRAEWEQRATRLDVVG